ncbi:MAG: transposase, partial [Planctomycetaceae bacterium]
MLATPSRLDPQRRLSGSVEALARKTRSTQGRPLGRSDRRWLVFTSKKGGADVGYGRKGKGTTIMLMVDGEGTPLSAFTTAANVSEVHAVETLVDERATAQKPERLMYDKAADADWLREALELRGIALVCPHRANRNKPPQQDGRALRRYKRRYKVE